MPLLPVATNRVSTPLNNQRLLFQLNNDQVALQRQYDQLSTGRDYRARDAGGAIDTLLRLERAVRDGDIPEIGRLQARLDGDLDLSTQMRGRVGVWQNSLQELRSAVEDETVLLKGELSNEIDADLATVISELGARQASLEASMRFIGQTSDMTVLN